MLKVIFWYAEWLRKLYLFHRNRLRLGIWLGRCRPSFQVSSIQSNSASSETVNVMNMKLAPGILLFGFVPAMATFRPQSIPYASLLKGEASAMMSFAKALSESGMITVQGMPNRKNKEKAMVNLYECILDSKVAQEHVFSDGTRRLTLATHSVPGGIQSIDHQVSTKRCESFDEAANSFRSTVETTVQAFARGVSQYFELEDSQGFLLSSTSGFVFKEFSDIVEAGEHLEHFHSYEKIQSRQGNKETIEMHVDQGLFIAFTPGQLIARNGDDTQGLQVSSGFFVELRDGSIQEVAFDEKDDLVFMLGDGVSQYVNEKLANHHQLRAVPHALIMNAHEDSVSRVWYGRMVLPPVDAMHPHHDMSFGELRDTMISASLGHQEDENPGIGCSGGMVARDLSATTCEGDSLYCWHRCMTFTEGVDHETCAERGLAVHCINPRLQLWAGELHGDYYPACADNSTQEVETPFPTLDEFPRSEETCTEEAFLEFANVTGYDFSNQLPGDAFLVWSIVDNKVKGRIAYNGLFGWLSFGFAGNPNMKNGMHEANVLLALPGGNYSGFSGLDLDLPASIAEYEVHPTETPFRHWQTPLAISTSRSDNGEDKIEHNECFTAMSFETSSIGKYTFNLDGKDELLWAADGNNAYVQYHGLTGRGRFSIDWPTGKVTFSGEPHDNHDDHDHDNDDDHDTSEAAPFQVFPFFGMMMMVIIVVLV